MYPLNSDGVLNALMFSLKDRDVLCFLETVDAVAPLDEEVKMFLDLVFDGPDDGISQFP